MIMCYSYKTVYDNVVILIKQFMIMWLFLLHSYLRSIKLLFEVQNCIYYSVAAQNYHLAAAFTGLKPMIILLKIRTPYQWGDFKKMSRSRGVG